MKKFLTTAVVAALLCAGCGSKSAIDVKNDLSNLLTQNNISFSSIPYCTHKSGNDYVCEVDGTTDSNGNLADQSGLGTTFVNVTDDGKSIFEQGIQ